MAKITFIEHKPQEKCILQEVFSQTKFYILQEGQNIPERGEKKTQNQAVHVNLISSYGA